MMRTPVFFLDSEAIMVQTLKALLSDVDYGLPLRIATQRHPNGWNGIEIIVRADASTIFQRVTKEQDYALTIYVKDPQFNLRYMAAQAVAQYLEGILPLTSQGSNLFALTDNISVSTIASDDQTYGETEIRYIIFTTHIKGTQNG